MRNDPIGATGEAMPAITRRAVLTTGAAAAAMATVPAVAAPASPISAELADLIANLMQAIDTWKNTIDSLEYAQDAWKAHVEANPLPMVPYFGGALDAGLFDREDMESQIRLIFCRQREFLPAYQKMDAGTAEAMAAVLRTREAETVAVAHRTHDDIDRIKAEFGLTGAVEAYEATSDAWEQALWDLLEYDTTTLAEERTRAAALIGNRMLLETMSMDERFFTGFVYAVAGMAHPDAEV